MLLPVRASRTSLEYRVTLDEAQAQRSELIDAAVNGETVLITRDGDQTVQLVPLPSRMSHPHFGSGKGLMVIADDFGEDEMLA